MAETAEGPPIAQSEGPSEGTDHVSVPTVTPEALAAISYAERDWRVIWAPRGSKHPAVRAWQDRATTDIATVVRWWTANPAANVCIATGRASGIFVLDVDDKGGVGGSVTLAALERQHGDLPDTYTHGTGSTGVHYFFNYDGIDFDVRNSAGKLGSGLDIRADGGQVVAPPSRVDEPEHVMPYVALVDAPVAAAPKWLIDRLRPPRPTVRPMPPNAWLSPPQERAAGLLGWLAKVQPGHGQDDALCWAVRALRDEGVSREAAGDLLRPVVLGWPCSKEEPWTERDIERHLRSAYKGAA
ncbi:bifunctional DNA primase/polymerase [Streptomyces sp. NPDC002787]